MQQAVWFQQTEEVVHALKSQTTETIRHFAQRAGQRLRRDFFPREPEALVSKRQWALTHALQLYDVGSVQRLIANYDLSQDVEIGIVPRMQKSGNSLVVIQLLESFTFDEVEARALRRYRQQLEQDLQRTLQCEVGRLYDEDQIHHLLARAPSLPRKEQQQFLQERLHALFSGEYLTYLILKNRYFLSRLRQSMQDETLLRWLQRRLDCSTPVQTREVLEKLQRQDFRTIEQLVRELQQQFAGHRLLRSQPPPWFPEEAERFEHAEQKPQEPPKFELAALPASVENHGLQLRERWSEDLALKTTEAPPRTTEATTEERFAKLLERLQPILQRVQKNMGWAWDMSSPFFRPRVEDYVAHQAQEIQQTLDLSAEAYAELGAWVQNVTTQEALRSKTWRREEAVDVWKEDEDIAEMIHADTLLRTKDVGLTFCSRLPMKLELATSGAPLQIEKGRAYAVQLGVAYFDQDLSEFQRHRTSPRPYFRVMFRGQQLQRRSALIQINQEAYFLVLPEQVAPCVQLLYFQWMILHRALGFTLPESVQEHLLQAFP